MRPKLLLTTAALGVVLSATGFAVAQDRTTDDPNKPKTIQNQGGTQPTPANPSAQPSGTTAQTPPSTTAPANTTQSQSNPSPTPNAPASTTSQTGSGQTGTNPPASAQSSQPTSPQTNQPAAAQATSPQQTQPSAASSNQINRPATAQQPATNQNTAAQTNAATVSVSASLQPEQKTRLTQAVAKLDVKPLTNVNFSVSVGTALPRSVTLHPVPSTIVSIVPQYRGYNYVVVRDQIVIVEPSTYKIVDVIERGGPARAQATTTQPKLNLSTQQKEIIRKHYTTRRTTITTGSAPRSQTRVIVGEDAPESVAIESFPEEVYREVPAIRSYRYIQGDRGIYFVGPEGRRVIEEFD